MPDVPDTRITVNSYVLSDLARAALADPHADVTLLETIKDSRHRIVVTKKLIEHEYEHASLRYGLSMIIPGLNQLNSDGVVVRPSVSRVPRLKGVKHPHRTLIEEALRANSKYFLTQRDEWLRLASAISKEHSLVITTPATYIKEQRRN